jgi:hypothetical protein
MNHLPAEVALKIRDKHQIGSLSTEELFSDTRPDAKVSAAVMAYHTRKSEPMRPSSPP